MKEQKAEGSQGKTLLVFTAYCFLLSVFLNPHSEIRIPQSVGVL
ncbi:MAG TPA: hypothetical protein VF791_23235 [Pyrinomonadaceae bacterium]